MASNNVPISCLVGVFLDDSQPSSTAAPVPFAYQPSTAIIKPGLKQVFFIGDGFTGTGTGTPQRFVVPSGATRLFLGTQDGCAWNDNGGSFDVSVAVHSTAMTVPGTANPWLAAMPNGSPAVGDPSCPADSAPAQSPVLFTEVVPDTVLTFDVTGSTDHGGPPFGLTPDGGPLQAHIAENGLASNNVPISALVGVFLDDSQPSLTAAPIPFPYQPSAPVFKPAVKQVFYVGDGLTGTSTGTRQQFVVPTGATRLFLGTQDGCEWNGNGGSFAVAVSLYADLSPVAMIRLSQVEICWESLTNRTYQVQYRSDLTTNQWTDLGSPVLGNGTVNCIYDAILVDQPRRFYQIVSIP